MCIFSILKKAFISSILIFIILKTANHFLEGRNSWTEHAMVYKNYPVLVAHRGGRGIYPENTLEAFRISHYRYHADLLESDVQMTKDNKFVLLHNLELNETTNMTGRVRDYTLEELKTADAAYYFTEDGINFPLRGKGIKLTSLNEFLDEFYQQDVRISIELKDRNVKSAIQLMVLLESYPNLNQQVCVDCSNHPIQKFWRQVMGTKYCTENDELEGILCGFFAKLGLSRLFYHFFPNKVEYFFAPYQSFKGFDFLVNKFYVTLQDEMNVPMMYFTVNTEEEINFALSHGAKGVLTDRPDLAYKVYVERGLRKNNANLTKETEHYHVESKRDAWEFSTPTMRFVEFMGGNLPDSAFTFFFIFVPILAFIIVWDIIMLIKKIITVIFNGIISVIQTIFCCKKRKEKQTEKKKKE